MEKNKRKWLLYILVASFATWFMFRFDVDAFSREYFVFIVGLALVALIGGWSMQDDDGVEGQ